MRNCFIVIIVLLLTFLFNTPVYAATFTFSGTPASVSDNESFSANVTLSIIFSAGKSYYIRAAFSHPDSPSSYFGYTKNNAGNWYNGTPSIDKTQYYKVTMDDNNQWSGVIEVKPDSESSAYKGTGTYNFKLGRYTETGSTVTWCTSESAPCSLASISIVAATTLTPTSTPIPTSSPTNTPTPTKTSTPTPTKIPTSTPTKVPANPPTGGATATQTKSLTTGPKIEKSPSAGEAGSILAENVATETATPTAVLTAGFVETNLAKILIIVGGIFLVACGILFFKWKRKVIVNS